MLLLFCLLLENESRIKKLRGIEKTAKTVGMRWPIGGR